MRWMRTTIVGNIGTDEQVAHVLQWRTAPAPDVDQDVAAVRLFAEQVRGAWTSFLASETLPNNGPISAIMPTSLRYTEVRAAYLEQTAPGAKPRYLVPTQYATFGPNIGGTSSAGSALPYEVALCMSLNSNERGPRNRGRTYLGPLHVNLMGAEGNFAADQVFQVGAAFGAKVVGALNANSGCDLHIVSHKYATSIPVQGVRVGIVPDSQRRRRRSRPENYSQAWGTPIGGAAPPA